MPEKTVVKYIAHAGCGKTYALRSFVHAQLESHAVAPEEVCCVTYMREAARNFYSIMGTVMDEPAVKKNIGTMHHVAAGLLDISPDQFFTDKAMKEFIATIPGSDREQRARSKYLDDPKYYVTPAQRKMLANSGRIQKLVQLDGLARAMLLEEPSVQKIQRLTGIGPEYMDYSLKGEKYIPKYRRYLPVFARSRANISNDMLRKFSASFLAYKIEHDLYDYTDCITECLAQGLCPDVKLLAVDEFQDLNQSQYALYRLWRDSPGVEMVVIAGDDAQTIAKYNGACPEFLANEKATKTIMLKETRRHGQNIIENADRYMRRGISKFGCDIGAHTSVPDAGAIKKVYGDDWLKHLDVLDSGKSVYFLAATEQWRDHIRAKIRSVRPDATVQQVGDVQVIDHLLEQYRVLADLERGRTLPETDLAPLILNSDMNRPVSRTMYRMQEEFMDPKRAEEYREYRASCFVGQSDMLDPEKWKFVKSISEFGGRRIMAKKKIEVFRPLPDKHSSLSEAQNITKKVFVERYMTKKVDLREIVVNLHGIEYMPELVDIFPGPIPDDLVAAATIHVVKGGEADIVFLFMAVPLPARKAIRERGLEARKDVYRLFYTGATRPRETLIEVYGYLTDVGGKVAPSPWEV